MEAHVFAQFEFPREIIKRFPRCREPRHQFLIVVALDERIEDMQHHRIVGRQIVEVRIHRRDRRLQADVDVARLGFGAGEGRGETQERRHG